MKLTNLELKFSKSNAYAVSLGFIAFLISIYIYPYYLMGDQENYREFYNISSTLSIEQAYAKYFSNLGSLEPTYFLIVYFSSEYLSKDFLFSVINGLLFYFFAKIMFSIKVNKLIVTSFLFNFYFFVLFFAAERLKIGVVFFLFSMMFVGKIRFILLSVSLVSHLQMSIALSLYLLREISSDFKRLLSAKITKKMLFIVLIFFLMAITLLPLYKQLISKLLFYVQNSDGFIELLKPLFFYFLTLPYAKNQKFELTVLSILLLTITFFVGSERMVMFSYAVFLCYALRVRNGLNFGIFVTSVYFSIKSVIFLGNVLKCGEAFSCIG